MADVERTNWEVMEDVKDELVFYLRKVIGALDEQNIDDKDITEDIVRKVTKNYEK